MYAKMRVIVLFLCVSIVYSVKNDWTDPHEMKFSSTGKLKRSNSENNDHRVDIRMSKKNDLNETPSEEENVSLLFLKRTISLILNSASPEEGDSSVHSGSYSFQIDSEAYKVLKEFSEKGSIESNDLRRLDIALSEIFQNNDYGFINLTVSQFNNFCQIDFTLILMAFVCFIAVFHLFKKNFGLRYVSSYLVFLVVIVDYAMRYKYMAEEAEKHNIVNNIDYSNECDTDKMDWKQYILFHLKSKSCERKIVNPLDVLLHQLKYVIIIPLESFGTGMGAFSSELWSKLPFPWNLIMFPMMLIFVLFMLFFFTMALRDAPFKLNILYLIRLEFGKRHDGEDKISGRTLDRLLNFTWSHRPMVEPTTSSPKKICSKKNKTSIESVEENDISSEEHVEEREVSRENKKGNLECAPKDRKDTVEDENIDSNLTDCDAKKDN